MGPAFLRRLIQETYTEIKGWIYYDRAVIHS